MPLASVLPPRIVAALIAGAAALVIISSAAIFGVHDVWGTAGFLSVVAATSHAAWRAFSAALDERPWPAEGSILTVTALVLTGFGFFRPPTSVLTAVPLVAAAGIALAMLRAV